MIQPFARNQLVVCRSDSPLWQSEYDGSVVKGPRGNEICTVALCVYERPRLFARKRWYVMLVGYGLGQYRAENFKPLEDTFDRAKYRDEVREQERINA